ncbi:MAG TPA: redoxin domain-containing protein, partial [Lacibacter sp.]|nr:redoxin domain-containing protein [Lacibacter sp.]
PKLVPVLLFVFAYSFAEAQATVGLPKAVVYDRAGRKISTSSISDFDNPVIVMTYSDSWCTSCVDMISRFDRNYSQYGKTSSVKLIAINVDRTAVPSQMFANADRWKNVEVLHDRDGAFQEAMYTRSAPRILFMNSLQEVVHSEATFNIDVFKAYKLADNIKRNLIKAEKIYYDSSWFPVPQTEAFYYRQINKTSDGKWEVNDYFKNGTLQMRGKALLVHPLVRNGLYEYYYNNGKKQSEQIYTENKGNGKSTGWYQNGSIRYEYNLIDGQYDGKYTYYHPNSKIATTGLYSQGKATGTWYHYYASGKKRKETNWANGKREGRCVGWFEEGLTKFDVTFANDKVVFKPSPKYQYANGKPAVSTQEQGGLLTVSYFYETGQLCMLAEMTNTLSELMIYYENGKPMLKTTMSDLKTVHGKYITYYSSGGKRVEGTIFNNKPSGKAMSWYEDGTVFEKVDFTQDIWEYFDNKGNKISKPTETVIGVRKNETLDTKFISNTINWLETTVKEDGMIEGMN